MHYLVNYFAKLLDFSKVSPNHKTFTNLQYKSQNMRLWQPLSYHPYLVLNVNHICMCWIQALIHSPVPKLYTYIFFQNYI